MTGWMKAHTRSNVTMLQLNKHFMLHHGLGDVAPIPRECTPVTLTVLPMESAAQLCIDITVDEFVTVSVHLIEGTQTWVRIPERRSFERRQAVATHLREVAGLYSLPSFLRYIADCGFIRQ